MLGRGRLPLPRPRGLLLMMIEILFIISLSLKKYIFSLEKSTVLKISELILENKQCLPGKPKL